jgi:hypothetical protein
MRRRWLALLLCDAACLFPSLDDFSGSFDGGSDASDASADVIAKDAGDASSDASIDAATRFCAMHPLAAFCDDFDEAGTISPAWSIVNQAGDASMVIAQDMPVSAPNIARSTVAATTSSGEASIGRHVAVASGQTLSFGAALRADEWPAGPYASIASLYADQTHSVALVLGYNNKSPLLTVDGDDGGTSTFSVTLPQSGWFRFTFVLAVNGASSTLDLLVNGQTAIGGPKPGPPISGQISCYIGIYATSYPSEISWSFDDAYAEVN